jgi:hypothetical protein
VCYGENGPTTIIDGYVGELGFVKSNDIETITVLKMHKQQFTVLLVLMELF